MRILLAYNCQDWMRAGYHFQSFLPSNNFIYTYDLGYTVDWTDIRGWLGSYIPKGIPTSIQSVEKEMRTEFDLVIELDGTGIKHLTGFKKHKARHILWAMDTYRADKLKFFRQIQDDFDKVYVTDKRFVQQFRKSEWLPYGLNTHVYHDYNLPRKYEVSFVGTLTGQGYGERKYLLDFLSRQFKINVFTKVYRDEAAKIYSQSKVVFNHTVAGEINLKILEIMGCGAMLVTNRLSSDTGLYDMFNDGEHLVTYKDHVDLLKEVIVRSMKTDEWKRIGQAGMELARESHTYQDRFKKILKDL